jgi:hypothetical protein
LAATLKAMDLRLILRLLLPTGALLAVCPASLSVTTKPLRFETRTATGPLVGIVVPRARETRVLAPKAYRPGHRGHGGRVGARAAGPLLHSAVGP